VLRLFLRGVAATADDDLLRSSATVPYSSVGYSSALYFSGELTDAEQLGRHVAAELLDLGAGALGAGPALRGPGCGLMGNE
jgi:hydroxymethylbilane synthase